MSLDKVVRRVKLFAFSLFPSPRGPKTLQFVLSRWTSITHFVLPRWTSPSLFRTYKRYPNSKPFQHSLGLDFGSILDPKMIQKSAQHRSKIDVCTRLRFLINFRSTIWFSLFFQVWTSMQNEILDVQLIKKRSRVQTSMLDRCWADFGIIFGSKIDPKSSPRLCWKGFE